jgi:hypothetical protein
VTTRFAKENLVKLCSTICTLLGLVATTALFAEEAPVPVVPAEADAAASNWSNTGKAGAYGTSVVTGGSDNSRDPTIAGTTETLAYRLSLNVGLNWKSGLHTVQQDFLAKYGEKKNDGDDWVEDNDEVRYDGVYRFEFSNPQFGYGSWGWESVFTGPKPDEDLFTPGLLKAGAGYGHLYEDFWTDKSRFEARLGAAARKRYGAIYSAKERETEVGLEAFMRLQQELVKRLNWYVQYEGFSEFSDLGHVTNLITAGLSSHLSTYLTLELALRAYYESRPEDVAKTTDDGYNAWGIRQDTLLGLTYTW